MPGPAPLPTRRNRRPVPAFDPGHRTIWARIIYKSGVVQELYCTSIKVTRNVFGGITEISLTDADPKPLAIGVDEVAAVWTKDLAAES
jgi:hypothetical protein